MPQAHALKPSPPNPRHTLPLGLGAVLVVFASIGTSPLYALKDCVQGTGPEALAEQALGSASLIVWTLTLVVTLKYLLLVLRADHHGEGGPLALMTLAGRHPAGQTVVLIILGAAGAAFCFGDAILTPSITLLAAAEGLRDAWPAATFLVLPITLLALAALFLGQGRASAWMAKGFGPVMVVWFVVVGILGLLSLKESPDALRALDPRLGLRSLTSAPWQAADLLGSVFLAVTGAEALYADLGPFGRSPIRKAWLLLVFPALALNYLGQAAVLLREPAAVASPFFHLAPIGLRFPLVVLAIVAGLVASQAILSGIFSLTLQALQLGFLPRLQVRHTSTRQRDHLHVGSVNLLLAAGCVAMVLGFGDASALASAYGVAVSLTMLLTTMMLWVVTQHLWGWSLSRSIPVIGLCLIGDAVFLGANLLKVSTGGWFTLMIGGIVLLAMLTWHRGRAALMRRLQARSIPLDDFITQVQTSTSLRRVEGTAVFLSANPQGTPGALLHNLKHNGVVHRRVVVLCFKSIPLPHAAAENRVEVTPLPAGFWKVTARVGFMEEASLDSIRPDCSTLGLDLEDMDTTYFLGRESIVASRHPFLPAWQARIFRLLSRNAQQPSEFYRLPPNRVVELGVQVEI